MSCSASWYCSGDCSQCNRNVPDFDEEAYNEYTNYLTDKERDERD